MAKSLRVVDISGLNLPEKGDVVDWLEANPEATADDVAGLPTQEFDLSPETDQISAITLLMSKVTPQPIRWLWPGAARCDTLQKKRRGRVLR